MIKAVIFDIDNTLYSYEHSHEYGMRSLAAYCNRVFGVSAEETEECYKRANKIMMGRIGSETAAMHNRLMRMQCMLELWDKPLFPHTVNMYDRYWNASIEHSLISPGIIRFMQKLKERGIRIGIGTDMTAHIQYRRLEFLNLSPYIDFIVTSEEAGVEKPTPHLFELCVEKAGVPAGECAFIGDNLTKDVKGAWDNGLKGIWYTKWIEQQEETEYPVIRSFEEADVEEFLK